MIEAAVFQFDLFYANLPSSPNREATHHWTKRSRERRECRESTALQARSQRTFQRIATLQAPIELHLEVTRGKDGGRRTDLGNLVHQLKAVIDGIVDAGWMPDDGPNTLTGLSVEQRRADKTEADLRGVRVRVTLESPKPLPM